ncbi:hypothetical protein [Chryseobacterium foetidum]|uniref:hypothetical protein n=1 Tax=Chryseobacterium foetidum TaxID=2951057 RepID=UPI0021C6DDA2|nr:hypothetical protein [Chryseobacterium foetidum]
MKWLHKKELKDINSLKKVEETFGIKFPSDYQNIVLENKAATPSPNTVDTSRQTGKAFGELLNFNLDENEKNTWVVCTMQQNPNPRKLIATKIEREQFSVLFKGDKKRIFLPLVTEIQLKNLFVKNL